MDVSWYRHNGEEAKDKDGGNFQGTEKHNPWHAGMIDDKPGIWLQSQSQLVRLEVNNEIFILAAPFSFDVTDSGAAFVVLWGVGLGDDEAVLASQGENSSELAFKGTHLVGRDT